MVFDMKESSKQGEKVGERVREESKSKERRKIPEDTRELIAGGSRKSRKGFAVYDFVTCMMG